MKSRTLVSQVVNFEQDNALEREMVWCPNWRCVTTAGLHLLSQTASLNAGVSVAQGACRRLWLLGRIQRGL